MGVLPLQFKSGDSVESLGLTGHEVFDILGLDDNLPPQSELSIVAEKPDGGEVHFKVTVRINTPIEVDYYRNGGILNTVLRNML